MKSETRCNLQVYLSLEYLAVDNTMSLLVISIQLKTNKFIKGVELVVGKNDDLCLVTTLLSHLAVRGDSPGALFRWEDLTPLSKTKL